MTFLKSFYSVPVSKVSLYIDLPGIDVMGLQVDLPMINSQRFASCAQRLGEVLVSSTLAWWWPRSGGTCF